MKVQRNGHVGENKMEFIDIDIVGEPRNNKNDGTHWFRFGFHWVCSMCVGLVRAQNIHRYQFPLMSMVIVYDQQWSVAIICTNAFSIINLKR